MLTLRDEAATTALGRSLARVVRARGILDLTILLDAPLGAGKTALARGFLQELGAPGPIASPTYAIVHSYAVASHADVYRVDDLAALEQTGLLDDVGRGIWLIEWASRFPTAWPRERLALTLAVDHELRTVQIEAVGKAAQSLVQALT